MAAPLMAATAVARMAAKATLNCIAMRAKSEGLVEQVEDATDMCFRFYLMLSSVYSWEWRTGPSSLIHCAVKSWR